MWHSFLYWQIWACMSVTALAHKRVNPLKSPTVTLTAVECRALQGEPEWDTGSQCRYTVLRTVSRYWSRTVATTQELSWRADADMCITGIMYTHCTLIQHTMWCTHCTLIQHTMCSVYVDGWKHSQMSCLEYMYIFTQVPVALLSVSSLWQSFIEVSGISPCHRWRLVYIATPHCWGHKWKTESTLVVFDVMQWPLWSLPLKK